MKALPLVVASLVSLNLAGCAALIGVPIAESEAAIRNKDYPKLKDMCLGKLKIQSNIANHQSDTCTAAIAIAREQRDKQFLQPLCGRRKENWGNRFAPACEAMFEISVATQDAGAVGYLCDHDKYDPACRERDRVATFGDLSNPDCPQLRAKFESARNSFLKTDRAEPEEFGRVVAALAKCGEHQLIFESLAHIGDFGVGGYGSQLLLATEQAGGPALFESFQRYLAAHGGDKLFAGEHGELAGNHVSEWLIETQRTDLCNQLSSAATGAKESAIVGLTRYFVETTCMPAAPIVTGLLASDEPGVRSLGCEALGKIGGKAQIAKIKIVAETDRTNRVVERPANSGIFVKDYFVADACSKAIGDIQLRE